MTWLKRIDAYRLEGEHEGKRYSVETYVSPTKTSVHVRRDGRIVKYAASEEEAIRYLTANLQELPK